MIGIRTSKTGEASDPVPIVDHITVEGFKSIRAVWRLPLHRINMLIGANDAGKSNFLQIFALLGAIHSGRLADYVRRAGGASAILHIGARSAQSMRICLGFEDVVGQYEIVLVPTPDGDLSPRSEFVHPREVRTREPRGEGCSVHDRRVGTGLAPASDRMEARRSIRAHLARWCLYRFHDTGDDSLMRRASPVGDGDLLRADGSNLAAFLYRLRGTHEAAYSRIRCTARLVIPSFEDFHLEPSKGDSGAIRLKWIQRGTNICFDVSSLSDGSLRFVALAALLLQPKELRPSVIVVDQPEFGLHPYAIVTLAELLEGASASSRIVAATQSTTLLDHLAPEDVVVTERVNGETRIGRPDPQGMRTWLGEYGLSELWERGALRIGEDRRQPAGVVSN